MTQLACARMDGERISLIALREADEDIIEALYKVSREHFDNDSDILTKDVFLHLPYGPFPTLSSYSERIQLLVNDPKVVCFVIYRKKKGKRS